MRKKKNAQDTKGMQEDDREATGCVLSPHPPKKKGCKRAIKNNPSKVLNLCTFATAAAAAACWQILSTMS